ncbi:carboxypeptidase-like regulatory domain-containing protein [Pedobacter sp. SYP-B3415]|uniref:carboxypeptidase-like regulatory domain-containing protein n=1 Tax=Pedobacter sp. SYP-B3415 TaxID=2496641 RepID=UPI00101CF477|nr:carboxypeptidase-like regulatory domain-containing protein [Pedobacter sp. SYP-B3415]
MKTKKILPTAFCFFVLMSLGFSYRQQGAVQGKVNPPQGANAALAIIGSDTLRGTITSGNFRFGRMKAGVYQVLIRANSPYRDTTIRNVAVTDTNVTDLGVIRLPQ